MAMVLLNYAPMNRCPINPWTRDTPKDRCICRFLWTSHFRRRGGDDEDIDAMIASLKKKTSGRDMYDVVRGIEQQQQ